MVLQITLLKRIALITSSIREGRFIDEYGQIKYVWDPGITKPKSTLTDFAFL